MTEAPREKWVNIDAALREGCRGLPGGTTLPRLLAERRGKIHPHDRPALTEEQVLAWADAHLARTGQFPTATSGPVTDAAGEKWLSIDGDLREGNRGLPGGSSLARLLAARRGRRNQLDQPPLSEQALLAWADRHLATTGSWPTQHSGAVPGAPGEGWGRIDAALREGRRGLPGGSSIARLLAEHRGRRLLRERPHLTIPDILSWADAHFARVGRWPACSEGPVLGAPGETWVAVDSALRQGFRGLPGGSSLARLLGNSRQVRNRSAMTPFSEGRILEWADDHHARGGRWPQANSGRVLAAPQESWSAIQHALVNGDRGLAGGTSLARFLNEHRGVRHRLQLGPLDEETIVRAAEAYHRRAGRWPNDHTAASIPELPGETWVRVASALRGGRRGLGRTTLSQLLRRHEKKRQRVDLRVDQILSWARSHFERHGRWPNQHSGPVEDAPGETWGAVQMCLRAGHRGLPGGMTVVRLLKEHGLRA